MCQTDPNERLQIYLLSILQWLAKTNLNIVLVENSGYNFDELNDAKETYKDRFEVITFNYKEIAEAKYLENTSSKGECELFAINYVFKHSKLIQDSNFIIKVTARYFIQELETYLSQFDLNEFDCLTQENRNRCEMVGSHRKNFHHIFHKSIYDDNINFIGHVEDIWKYRTSKYQNVLVCKTFKISKPKEEVIRNLMKIYK